MTTRRELGALVDTDIRDNTTGEISPAVDRGVRRAGIDSMPTWAEMAGGWHAWYAAPGSGDGNIEYLDGGDGALTTAGAWSRVRALHISAQAYPTAATSGAELGDLREAVDTIATGQVAIVWESDTAIGAFRIGAVTRDTTGNPARLVRVKAVVTPFEAGTVGAMGASHSPRHLTVIGARLVELLVAERAHGSVTLQDVRNEIAAAGFATAAALAQEISDRRDADGVLQAQVTQALAASDLNDVQISSLTNLNFTLAAQATDNRPLLLHFIAEVTKGSATYASGTIAWVPPRSDFINTLFVLPS